MSRRKKSRRAARAERGKVTRTMVRSSSVRTVRTNPRRHQRAAILLARRGRTTLRFDGRNFSSKGRPKPFATLIAAYQKGEQLLRRHSVLRGYTLYVRHI